MSDIKDKLEDVGDKMKRGMKKTGNRMEEGAEKTGNRMEEGADETKDKADELWNLDYLLILFFYIYKALKL